MFKWECNVEDIWQYIPRSLQMIDVSFFMESCRILEIFRGEYDGEEESESRTKIIYSTKRSWSNGSIS